MSLILNLSLKLAPPDENGENGHSDGFSEDMTEEEMLRRLKSNAAERMIDELRESLLDMKSKCKKGGGDALLDAKRDRAIENLTL